MRKTLLLIIIAALLAGTYLWLRGSAESRAQAFLDDLQEGFERGQARLLVSLLDEQYPLLEHWPELESIPLGADADADDAPRQALQRILVAYFMRHRDQQRELHSELHQLQRLSNSDGRDYEAIISLTLSGPSHGGHRPPTLPQHRFVLRQRGAIFPSFYLIDHDAISLR